MARRYTIAKSGATRRRTIIEPGTSSYRKPAPHHATREARDLASRARRRLTPSYDMFRAGRLANPITLVKGDPRPVLWGRLASHLPFAEVHVKLLSEPQRGIEAVCAWLAREGQLPCPEPCFVRVSKHKVERLCSWPYSNDDAVCFGTLSVPNALPLRTQSVVAAGLLSKAKWLGLAAVFDHLIANDDRSEANILLAGGRDLYLIDHGRSMGAAGQRAFSTEAFPLVKTYFLDIIAREPFTSRMERRPQLIAACSIFSALVPRVPYGQLNVSDELAGQIRRFLEPRAERLMALVFDNVGMSQLQPQDTAHQPQSLQ